MMIFLDYAECLSSHVWMHHISFTITVITFPGMRRKGYSPERYNDDQFVGDLQLMHNSGTRTTGHTYITHTYLLFHSVFSWFDSKLRHQYQICLTNFSLMSCLAIQDTFWRQIGPLVLVLFHQPCFVSCKAAQNALNFLLLYFGPWVWPPKYSSWFQKTRFILTYAAFSA